MSNSILKLLGALMLLAAGVYAGTVNLKREKRELESMRDFCAALEILRGELATRSCGLPELIGAVRLKSHGDAETFFAALSASMFLLGEEEFSTIWTRAAKELPLPVAFRVIWDGIGLSLGRFDLGLQLSALERTEEELRSIAEKAERSYPDRSRVSFALPAAAAALLAIILI